MRKNLKLCLVLSICLLIFTLTSNVYASVTGTINLTTTKDEYSEGDLIVVEVKFPEISSESGTISISGNLKYDNQHLELVSFKGTNGWSNPEYNEDDGTFSATRDTASSSKDVIFKITFLAISSSARSVSISINDIVVSGEVEGNIPDAKKTISIINTNDIISEIPTLDNVSGNTTSNNVSNTTSNLNSNANLPGNTVSNAMIPNTGSSSVLVIVLITVFTSVAVYSYIKMRK